MIFAAAVTAAADAAVCCVRLQGLLPKAAALVHCRRAHRKLRQQQQMQGSARRLNCNSSHRIQALGCTSATCECRRLLLQLPTEVSAVVPFPERLGRSGFAFQGSARVFET